MGLGILETTKHAPGTVFVLDDASRSSTTPNLKYDRTGPVDIILVPQPSDDPNDPLNWPLWKRDLITCILSLVSVMAATLGPILAANTLTLSLYFERDFTAVALLTGYHLCGVGVAGVLCVASARFYGKRHLYLLGNLALIAFSVWAGRSTSYNSMLWARLMQGLAVAPFEALVNASVGDLYFVHQRGKRMALSNLALFGGAFFTPVLVGKITHTIEWRWSFYLVAIFSAAILPLVVFLVPETAFRRSSALNTDTASIEIKPTSSGNQSSSSETKGEPSASTDWQMGDEARKIAANPSKVSYLASLLPFNGRKTDENLLKLILRPFPLFFHPGVLWACLIQGTLIGWTVLIGVVLAAIFLGPPLFFDEVLTGYMYSGAFLGAVVGFLLAGFISDWSAKILTKRNHGVYEPEFRLVLVIPQLIFGCIGLYGFGICSEDVTRYGWFPPELFFGFEVMGMVLGAVASALYIVDAHREIAIEAFTCLLLFKNLFSFALTWYAYKWIIHFGIRNTFVVIASVQVAVCLLSIPMYFFGKRNRAFFHCHNILNLTHLA
ncbi:MAG: hypothetical protein M1829_004770 [Trizodia sp. TS-e1964]|nr:MAG: hypothetical protein M1829_004770 [Trizodia sp. TS-e1964]